jgi:hypothetical protein
MDLDAELPNNFSPKKTRVAYSEPQQDTELPSKVTDSTNTQTCGLCHNKKSGQVTFQVTVVDDEIQTHSLDLHYTQIPIGKGKNKEVSQSVRFSSLLFDLI